MGWKDVPKATQSLVYGIDLIMDLIKSSIDELIPGSHVPLYTEGKVIPLKLFSEHEVKFKFWSYLRKLFWTIYVHCHLELMALDFRDRTKIFLEDFSHHIAFRIGFSFGLTQHVCFSQSLSLLLQRTCQFCFCDFVQVSPSPKCPSLLLSEYLKPTHSSRPS